MFRFYTPIFMLQAFCMYQAYTRKDEQKWFWIIMIFPLLGCLFYLYHTYYSRRNVENLTEVVKQSFVSNYKIDQLEKELAFSDTVKNRMLLAEECMIGGDYTRSLKLFESCREGTYKDDPHLMMKLVKLNYLLKEYDEVIKYGQQLGGLKEFSGSYEKVALAWSYHEKGMNQEARKYFEEVDVRFSNYNQRVEYALFLDKLDESESSRLVLEELIDEIDSMSSSEKRGKKKIYGVIRNYHAQLVKAG